MLSSSWHVTLRLTVFEIFAVKWPKFWPTISDLWISGKTTAPKGEKICPRPIYTIMQNFTPIGTTITKISVTGQRKTSASARHIYDKRGGGAVKSICNILAPFSRATFLSLIVCLCLAHCRLLHELRLAIANRSRVSCAHNTTMTSIITPWSWRVSQGHWKRNH